MKTARTAASFVSVFLLFLAVACTGFIPSLQAQEDSGLFQKALPADTFMYMDVRNIQSHVKRYENLLQEQMSDEQKKTFNRRKDRLLDRIATRAKKETGVNPIRILSHVTRVQMAVPSSEFDMGMGKSDDVPVEEVSVFLSIHVDRADVFSQLLTGSVAKRLKPERTVNGYTVYRVQLPDKKDDVPTSYLLHRGKQMYVSNDLERLTSVAEGEESDNLPSDSLAGNDKFQASRSEGTTTEELFHGYMNVSSFWDQVASSMKNNQKRIYRTLAEQLGFEVMESVSLNFRTGKDVSSMSMAVNLSGGDFPLYDLLFQAEPGNLTMLNDIPGNAYTGSAWRIPDYGKRWSDIRRKTIDLMSAFGQERKKAKNQWNMAMMMTKKQLNVGVKKLLSQFGDEMAWYMKTPGKEGEGDYGAEAYFKHSVMRMSVDDGEAFQQMFDERIRSSDGFKNVKNMETTEVYQGTTLYSYETPDNLFPTFFFHGDEFVVTFSKSAAKTVIDGDDSGENSIKKQSWYQTLRPELPASVSYLGFIEYGGYSNYMMALQEQAGEQGGDFWSEMMFDKEAFQNLYDSSESGAGSLFSASTHSDRISVDFTGQIDISGINPDEVNRVLKKMNDDLKETNGN